MSVRHAGPSNSPCRWQAFLLVVPLYRYVAPDLSPLFPTMDTKTRARFFIQVLSFQILAHSLAFPKSSTLFFSNNYALFCKNTRGWGYPPLSRLRPSDVQTCGRFRSKLRTRRLSSVPPRLCGCPFHLPYALPSSVSCNLFVCHSYENCRVSPQQFPIWDSSSLSGFTSGHNQVLSFHTLAHSFALIKNSTLFFSIASALFAKKPPGVGYPPGHSSPRSPASGACPDSVGALSFCLLRRITGSVEFHILSRGMLRQQRGHSLRPAIESFRAAKRNDDGQHLFRRGRHHRSFRIASGAAVRTNGIGKHRQAFQVQIVLADAPVGFARASRREKQCRPRRARGHTVQSAGGFPRKPN